jgi:hypothetical protein
VRASDALHRAGARERAAYVPKLRGQDSGTETKGETEVITIRDTLRIAQECGWDVSPGELEKLHRFHRLWAACDRFGYKGCNGEAMDACLELADTIDEMSLRELEELYKWLKKRYPDEWSKKHYPIKVN